MGIRYFVFAVNKMDLVKYDKNAYDKIVGQIEELKMNCHLKTLR